MKEDDKNLLIIFHELDESSQKSLLDFAEYLLARQPQGEQSKQYTQTPLQPLEETASQGESVIAAIKRMRRVYFMLDVGDLFNEASSLVTANIVGGRHTPEVIQDIEALFAKYYQVYLKSFVKE